MEEKLDKFLAYLEENGVEISGETAFKCDDGIVLFNPFSLLPLLNCGTTVDTLVKLNGIKNKNLINIGQVIKLP